MHKTYHVGQRRCKRLHGGAQEVPCRLQRVGRGSQACVGCHESWKGCGRQHERCHMGQRGLQGWTISVVWVSECVRRSERHSMSFNCKKQFINQYTDMGEAKVCRDTNLKCQCKLVIFLLLFSLIMCL